MATMPSLTGSSVFAAAWAIDALPSPASFEKAALRTPVIITPKNPPKTAFAENASVKMSEILLPR